MDETPEERRKRQQREATARYRIAHPDKVRKGRAARRAANLDEFRRKDREAKARWHLANLETHRARALAWTRANPEANRKKAAAWRKANPEREALLRLASQERRREKWDKFLADERERYQRADKGKYFAKGALRRATKLRATPSWADLDAMIVIYQEAQRISLETGIPHDVDHIIPLRGRMVCGLHIPINLRVIPSSENRRKFNKVIDVGDASKADRPGISPT